MANKISQAAAQRILKSRPVFPALKPGETKTLKLEVRSVSEKEFPTTLIDEETGESLQRRIVNFVATNKARMALPEVKEAFEAGNALEVLNETELTSSILSSSSLYNKLQGGDTVTAKFTAVDGESKDGADYAGTVINVKIMKIHEAETLETAEDLFDFPMLMETKSTETV